MKRMFLMMMVCLLMVHPDVIGAPDIIKVFHDLGRKDLTLLRQEAQRNGYRLDVSDDGVTAVMLKGDIMYPIALKTKDVPIEDTPTWQSDDSYAVGGLRWADIDGDGDLDLVSAHYEGGYPARPDETRVWFNENGVLQTQSAWTSTDGVWSTDVVVGDIDGNHRIDVYVTNGWTDSNVIYLQGDYGLSTAPSWSCSEGLFTVAGALGSVTSITTEGFLDPVAVNQPVYPDPGQPNHLYANSSGIPSTSATWTSEDIASNMGCALGDFDEDGLHSLEANFTGDGFKHLFSMPHVPIHSIDTVEIDGTSVTDYVCHYRDGWIAFRHPPSSGAVIQIHYTISTDLDLAVSVDHGSAKIYRDTGTTFESLPFFTVSDVEDQREKGAAWVDVDLDGDLDLFIAGRNVPMMLYENVSGVISQTPVWQSDDTAPDVSDMDWIDMDGDGDLDLATVNNTTSPVVRIYVNQNGVPETSPSWGIPWGGSMAMSVAWGDMNNDGRPDLAVAYASAPLAVYLNTGSTEPPTATPTPTSTPSPTPTATPTETPSPEPTPTSGITGVSLLMPSHLFFPGDTCYLDAILCNGGDIPEDTYPLFIILDVYGEFFYAPSFSASPDVQNVFLKIGETKRSIISTFTWPDTGTQADDIFFYGGLTNQEMTELLGRYGEWRFGWR